MAEDRSSEGAVGGEKVIPGHPEAICCLFLPQAGGCSPGTPRRMPAQRLLTQSFQQMASPLCCGRRFLNGTFLTVLTLPSLISVAHFSPSSPLPHPKYS